MMTGYSTKEQTKACELDVPFCDYYVNCDDCPLYMDDCEGDPEKIEDYDE